MSSKTGKKKRAKRKGKTERKGSKAATEKKQKVEEQPARRVDIDTEMYRDLFKFLEEKVSVECFINLHDQCYGKTDCQCECHSKKP